MPRIVEPRAAARMVRELANLARSGLVSTTDRYLPCENWNG
jgi:hypothetical protein